MRFLGKSSTQLTIILSLSISGMNSANAGWFSHFFETGQLPTLDDAAACIISPSVCLVVEGGKEVIRQKEKEKQIEVLKNRLVEYQNDFETILKSLDVKSEEERLEIRFALNKADNCLLKATKLSDADNCSINMRRDVLKIHRKYQNI